MIIKRCFLSVSLKMQVVHKHDRRLYNGLQMSNYNFKKKAGARELAGLIPMSLVRHLSLVSYW